MAPGVFYKWWKICATQLKPLRHNGFSFDGLITQDLEAMGAIQALKEHDLYPQVKCIGVDGEVDILNDIKADGSCIATVVSDLDSANVNVVDACEALMAGEDVAKYHEIPYAVVTKENVDEFLEKATAEAEKYAE